MYISSVFSNQRGMLRFTWRLSQSIIVDSN